MTSSLVIRDLAAYAGQVALVVAAGGVLARVCAIDRPRAALAYWRALLFACLLLPVLQPWTTSTANATPAVAPPDARVEVVAASPADAAVPPTRSIRPTARDVLLSLVAAGIVARLLWLAAAARSLRRLRRTAVRIAPLPPAIEAAQAQTGVRAEVCVSDRVSSPITFGARSPIVILPPAVLTMDARMQQAIACHELVHVRRRDWLDEIFEEGIRTILWFHPAIWWLIARIQLTREQVVDRTVIDLTQARDSYVDALLSVALSTPHRGLAPAPLFLRRGLLKRRIARILEEHTMTTRRLIASLTVSAAALAMAAALAVRAFPLEAQGQPAPASSGRPVEIVQGGDHLLHGEPAEYPRRALERKVGGDVLLELTLDDQGQVSDARVLSGPDELRKAALEAALQWHYAPSALRSTSTQATLRFDLAAASRAEDKHLMREKMEEARAKELKPGPNETYTFTYKLPTERMERQLDELKSALANPDLNAERRVEFEGMFYKLRADLEERRRKPENEAITLKLREAKGEATRTPQIIAEIRSERLSTETVREIVQRAGVRVGDLLTDDTGRRITEALAGVDEHLVYKFVPGEKGFVLTIVPREN